MRTPLLLPLMAALALTACNQDTDPGPGGVSVGEARALDEAAQMLEEGRPELPVDATPQGDAAPTAQDDDAATMTPAPRPTSAEERGGPQPATLPTAQ